MSELETLFNSHVNYILRLNKRQIIILPKCYYINNLYMNIIIYNKNCLLLSELTHQILF